MPGVTNGENWTSRDSHLSDFESFHARRDMSPQRRHEVKSGSMSQYSNGYSTDQHSEHNEGKPTYLLEHLATFSVGAQYGLSTPKDGLRRLLQMEKSSGIWTQKMQMRLEKKWVVIIDNENGDVVERFPMSLISEPTSYTSNDPRELYNNILIFIVKDDPKNKNHNPPEMHIFQCARVSAQEVVDEMKMFISGKWKPGYRDNNRHIPPPPNNPPPEPPVNGVSVREQVNLFNAAAAAAAAASPPRSEGMIQRVTSGFQQRIDRVDNRIERTASYGRDSNDETSSTSSEKYERDVAILNHCFDDIERFIARLQHAAAAFKELERRQKSRKNKKKDMGDGMLSMRAKPPTEREFLDILQKFKLSFNLLAKLKSHIHDPNAPELVHFLFTPLALIVDAAKDSNYSTTLPSRVVAPLLTRDAMELLMNCCTSKESDLWQSLGDSWIIPRDQWKGYEGNFHPVFSDGWAPENPFSEDKERAEVTAAAAATAAQKFRREEVRRAQEEAEMRHQDYRVSSRQDRESRFGSEYYYSERGERDRPNSPVLPPEMAHPTFDNRYYDAQNLEVSRRDIYDRGGAHSPVSDRDFTDNRDRDMRSDFSADSIEHGGPLDPHRQFERHQKQWLEDLKLRAARVVQVMYPRTANNDKELTVIRGEFLEVLDDSRKWWKARNIRGQVAHVPHTIVGPPPTSGTEEDTFNNPLYGSRNSGAKDAYYTPSDSPVGRERTDDSGPKEPAPQRTPAIPTPAPADWVKRERQGKKDRATNNSTSSASSEETLFKQSPTRNETFEDNIPEASSSSVNTVIAQSEDHLLSHHHHHDSPSTHTKGPKGSKSILPKSDSAQDLLHEELKLRVSLGPKIMKRYGCPQHQNIHCTYLTAESTPAEVQHWLDTKGFSSRTQQGFQNMKGEEIFQLTKSHLEKFLGAEEGTRLFNQVTIQKNICGFKTTTAKELSSILEARRKKIEPEDSFDESKNLKVAEISLDL